MELTGGSMVAMGCGFGFGVASVIYTEFTPTQIKNVFDKSAEATDDILPVVVFNWDDEAAAISLNAIPDLGGMLQCIDQFIEDQKGREVNLTLDELLDKIKESGIESLSPTEMSLLISLSGQ
jgi:hypothetical protein